MVSTAIRLFIANFNTGCQKSTKLFIRFLVLSGLHTEKNTFFKYIKSYIFIQFKTGKGMNFSLPL